MKHFKSILVSLFSIFTLSFACVNSVYATQNFYQESFSPISVNIDYQNGIKKIEIQRNFRTQKTNFEEETKNIYLKELEKHNAQSALIQVEAFSYNEELNSLQHVNMQATAGDSNTIWHAADGDIYIVTAAYLLGYDTHNQPIYKAYGEVHATRNFYFHNEDCFAIKHGYNATFYTDGVNMTGTLSYHAKEYRSIPYAPGGITEEDRSFSLTPLYPDLLGVMYNFTWPADYDKSGTGGGYTIINRGNYTNRKVTGQYAIIATGTTAIQVYYVYNKLLFGGSLSISLGPIGAAINVSGSNQTYAAQPLTVN